MLVLCAHLEAGNQIVRALGSRRGALFGIHRVTLNVLAYQLALPRLVESGLATHSLLGQQALAARVAHQAKEDGALGAFSAVVHGPGFARALAATLNELRLHEVAPAELAATGSIGESLAELLERYQKASLSAGLADRAEVLRTAARVAESGDKPHHPCLGLPTLILDVPVRSPVERNFIASVVRRARNVLVTLPEGDERTRGALEEALAVSTDAVFGPGDVSESIHHLQRYLFSGAAPPARPTEQNVVVLSAPGEAQEAVELARYVQSEAASGVPFDSMAVLLRAPDLYTPLLEDAFARARVPGHFETGTPRPAPAGRAFLALLDCAGEDLSASRFAEYLSLGQLPELDASGGPEPRDEVPWIPPRHELAPPPPGGYTEPVQLDLFAPPAKSPAPEKLAAIEGTLRAPWRWESLLVDAAVIGGRERWERRLAGLARELRERIAELEDPQGTEAAALEHRLEDLKHLETFALPVITMLAELPEKATWGRWLDVLEKLATRVLSLPDGVLAVLKELRPMALVGPVELFEVREVLNDRLTQLSQDPPPYRYGRVWVAPIEAVRGLAFDVVLVPGLAERVFPRKIVEDPLLLDLERQKLGAGLALQGDRIV
ncbi:MAG TPA: PD-(D/E)XK nuclease family protein, partial [Vicinamibacteria bacterium]